MKKLINGALFLVLVGMVMVGCEKEESMLQYAKEKTSLKKKTKNQEKNNSELIYLDSVEFESEFDAIAIDFYNLNNLGAIEEVYLEETMQHALELFDDGFNDTHGNDRIVYRGSQGGAERVKWLYDNDFIIGFEGCNVSVIRIRNRFNNSTICWGTIVRC